MNTHKLIGFSWRAALVIGVLAFPAAAQHVYTEDFTTTTYMDPINTTAVWNTAAGQLELAGFQSTFVGSYDTPGNSADVVVSGDMAFVADGGAGLTIIDITNPSSPSLLGSYDTPGSAQGLWVDGDRAYVCDDGPGLLIIDVSNPAAPSLVGTYDTGGRAFGVEVAGHYAYVADGGAGLTVVDISNPAAPVLAGNYDTPGFARSIDVEGNYAYIADRAGGGLQIIDISNPALPTFGGSYDVGGDTWGVEVLGDVAYLGAASVGLVAVDVTDPTNPTLLSTTAAGSARQLDVEGDFVYVAGYDAVYAIDVRDPSNPESAGSYATPGIASAVVVAGEQAYVADGTDGGLQVVDACDPVELSEVGSCSGGFARCVVVAGDYAYLAGGTYGMYVIDISDPTNPTIAGEYNTPGACGGVAVSGDYAYVADASAGVQVLNISDPTTPSYVANYDTLTYNALDVAVSGDHAYVAYEYIGLLVIDISDPTNPSLAGSYDTPGAASDVVLSGDYAYVADRASGLQVIDISDPTSPSLAGNYDTAGEVWGVATAGDYAYLGDGEAGVQVIDITNPASPSLAGSYDTFSDDARNIAISGDYAYVADAALGLRAFDVSDPTNPTLAASNGTPGYAVDVAVAGDYAFVADSNYKLWVMWVRQRFLEPAGDTGQSVSINSPGYEIGLVQLSSTQNDSIRWEVSGNGGVNWRFVPSNTSWYVVAVPGNALRWRSRHVYSQPLVNPACSNLVISWFATYPLIDTITDIPNDQGHQLGISWIRSGYDYVGSPTPVTEYAIYRKIDDGLATSPGAGGAAGDAGDKPITVDGERPSLAYPPGDWHFIMTVPADCEETYAAVVSTLADSSITEGTYYTTFFVSALTASPAVYFDSPPDSGYSVDNLAPAVPSGFVVVHNAGSGNELTWEECPNGDFVCFRIYRDETEDFEPNPGVLAHTTADTHWLDTVAEGWKYFYKITAVDEAGNESTAASPGWTTGADASELPRNYALYQNIPNPFNPVTTIRFDLPVRSHVKLTVYNVKGQRVRILLDRDMDAGSRTATWEGTDAMGRGVASGIYFYRLDTPNFSESRRMILLR